MSTIGSPGEHSPEPQRVFAKRRAHPIFARSCGVSFVENEINHFEHRRQSSSQVRAAGNFKGNAGLGKRALGANDTLCDGWLRYEEGAGNFLCGQAAE